MLCPSCNTEIPAGQRFCGRCESKIDDSNDLTVTSDATRLAGVAASAATELSPGTSNSGWLTSSGSIDHGRFGPGSVLDARYRIIGLLGKGGMGEVYRADDLRLGQPVALKFLPQSLAADARRLAQLHNEVRTARQVSHTNVCRVYDIGDVEGQLFLSMEYVDGEDLAASLRRVGRFPEDKGVELARQICAGLASAHDRGIIHRDLKPANIMIDGQGRVRIMDFGLAAAGSVEEVRVGTPAYMAPEQLEGREVTKASDIYALGLVLYELFTGKRAFTAKSIAELLEQQTSGSVSAPTEIVKGLDPSIERAIERCLERDPARRPKSALEVAMALPGADPVAAALAAGETPSPAMVAALGGEAATVTVRRGLAWIGIALVLAVIVTSLTDRVSSFSRVPLTKPPAVLADKAEELRTSLGYTEPFVDSAYGYIADTEYMSWADHHRPEGDRFPQSVDDRPAMLQFWYRTSPRVLSPYGVPNSRNLFDPPFTGVTGMTIIRTDLEGRLLSFEAMPRQIDPAEQFPSATVDWPAIMAKAGLDPATFTEITPGRTPRTYADARHAYRGLLPGTEIPVTVEAASYRGKPVYFELIGPWTAASRDPGAEAGANDGNGGPVQIILLFTLLIVAALLTRANLRSGRADRRGAFRFAAFMVVLFMAIWALQPHVRALADEKARLYLALGIGLFLAGAMYIMYLAVEPYIRRGWPESLVSWTRLLSGRIRDAHVGRDLLIGVGCGLALTLIERLEQFLPGAIGWPERIPVTPFFSALLGVRMFSSTVLNAISSGIQGGLITTILPVAVLRSMLQQRMTRRGVKRISVDAVTFVVALVVAMGFTAADNSRDPAHMWLPLLANALTVIVLLLVARIGVLAVMIVYAVNILLERIPITFDGSRFYAGEGWLVLALVLAAAMLGYKWARAGEPLMGTADVKP